MNHSDSLAYQIGRTILDLHIAKQTIQTQADRIAALEERLAEQERRLHSQSEAA